MAETYNHPGIRAFVDAAAPDDPRAGEKVARLEPVRRIDGLLGNLAALPAGDKASREELGRQVAEHLATLRTAYEATSNMVEEATRAPGGLGPVEGLPTRMRAHEGGSPRAPAGPPVVRMGMPRTDPQRTDGLYHHEQPMGPDGQPLTLDPNNPAHAELIRNLPSLPVADPSQAARMQVPAGDSARRARVAELHLKGVVSDADLIRGTIPDRRGDAGQFLDPGVVDRDWDRWMQSPEGQRAVRRVQDENRIRATGAKLGMSGGPPRPDPGVNQDINQQDVPTNYDEPDQVADPFQTKNPPWTEPNETGAGILGTKTPQTAYQGSGVHLGSIAAGEGEPFEQAGPSQPLHGQAPLGALPATQKLAPYQGLQGQGDPARPVPRAQEAERPAPVKMDSPPPSEAPPGGTTGERGGKGGNPKK